MRKVWHDEYCVIFNQINHTVTSRLYIMFNTVLCDLKIPDISRTNYQHIIYCIEIKNDQIIKIENTKIFSNMNS